MDISSESGYVLVDEEGNVRARLSRDVVESGATIVPFKGLRLVSESSRSLDHLADLFNADQWLPD